MKFYLDEDVDVGLALVLRAKGHYAETTNEAGNKSASDESQLIYAMQQEAVLVSHNRRHFRRLHRTWMITEKQHAGIILSRHLHLSELERRLTIFLNVIAEGKTQNMLFNLGEFI